MRPYKAVNLDFEARVPVPFSIFPSSYRETDKKESVTTSNHEEVEIQLPQHHRHGREGTQVSSYSAASADPRPRKEKRYSTEEEVFIVREEREDDRYRRPGVRREEYYREELKEQQPRYYPIPTCFLLCSSSTILLSAPGQINTAQTAWDFS